MLVPTKEEARYVNFEVFPASYVFTETGRGFGNQLKVVCTAEYVIVYADKDVVQFITKLISFEKKSYKLFIIQTTDGEMIVTREDNCGCGNQLRGFNPFVGVPHIAQYPFLKGT